LFAAKTNFVYFPPFYARRRAKRSLSFQGGVSQPTRIGRTGKGAVMKQSLSVLLFAAIAIGMIAEDAVADPGMSGPKGVPVGPVIRPPVPPLVIRPRVPPPIVRVAPPVVRVVPPPVVVAPAAPTGGVTLSNNAWIGQHPTTRLFSIAFDSPGVSGPGILIKAGYSNIVRGPTNWTDATTFLKSIGAPGW
jgi:hypothetical protein